ncbi:DNA polymerase III subunit epsilon [Buchnera aphidicola (Cinara piceae)]|uniref:DNA polymerase III subunit epsilon n=1 Tax=Buchnera aphidicola (Cinara piceae) TaxID=1660043 RepID=A0A803FTS8_9GAMM|nr:DNA polymerase III subunit epsilon [Buchnera aphidicola]VFP88213.1 DNA polymerase III subunit epsilon [Buchnera aphidicola (Cinara piceae)]
MNNINPSRKVILDIETTGMNQHGCLYLNHKIIEIGIIEVIDRKYTGKYLHFYLNPKKKIDKEAYKIHGISDSFLLDKPTFNEVYIDILNFIKKSEIIVHNAIFDISFLDYEFSKLNYGIKKISQFSTITDTLLLARKIFPGKKNSLDALCKRYKMINVNRELHNALLDAKILMKLYLYMTSKQEKIKFNSKNICSINLTHLKKSKVFFPLKVLFANSSENKKHKKYIKIIKKKF